VQQKVGPGVIAISVVALLVVIFLLYHFTMGGGSHRGQPPITADNRPEYVKQLERGQRPTWAPITTQPGQRGMNGPANGYGQGR